MENSSKFFNVTVNLLPVLASLTVHSHVCQHTVIALKNFTIPPATKILMLLLKEKSYMKHQHLLFKKIFSCS